MLSNIIIGGIFISLGYLTLSRPKKGVIFLLSLLPFHAFLKTSLSSLLKLNSLQTNILASWKEFILFLLFVLIIYKLIKKEIKLDIELPDYLLLILLFISVISFALTGFNFQALLLSIKYNLIILITYFLTKQLSFSKKEIKQLVKAVIIVGVIAAIFALAQNFLISDKTLAQFGYLNKKIWEPLKGIPLTQKAQGHKRAVGTFSGPNQLGAFLSFISLLLIGWMYKKRSEKKIMGILGLAVCILPLVFSFSRSAWAGFVISIIIFFIFWGIKHYKRALLIISAVIFLLAVIFWPSSLQFNQIFESFTRHTDRTHLRAPLQSIQLLIDNPFGVGVGKTGPAAQWLNKSKKALVSENFYLQIGLELGILGLLAYLASLYYITKRIYSRFKNMVDKEVKSIHLAILLGLTGSLISALFLHSLTDCALAISLGALLGASTGLRGLKFKRKEA